MPYRVYPRMSADPARTSTATMTTARQATRNTSISIHRISDNRIDIADPYPPAPFARSSRVRPPSRVAHASISCCSSCTPTGHIAGEIPSFKLAETELSYVPHLTSRSVTDRFQPIILDMHSLPSLHSRMATPSSSPNVGHPPQSFPYHPPTQPLFDQTRPRSQDARAPRRIPR